MTDLTVHDVRLFPKCPLDGTTATSADLELPGPLRTLAWAAVIDDAATFGVHMLIDSHDVHACAAVALRTAPAHLGRSLTSGIWFVTTSRIDAATVGTYPVPARALRGTWDFDEPVATVLADTADEVRFVTYDLERITLRAPHDEDTAVKKARPETAITHERSAHDFVGFPGWITNDPVTRPGPPTGTTRMSNACPPGEALVDTDDEFRFRSVPEAATSTSSTLAVAGTGGGHDRPAAAGAAGVGASPASLAAAVLQSDGPPQGPPPRRHEPVDPRPALEGRIRPVVERGRLAGPPVPHRPTRPSRRCWPPAAG